MKNLMRSILIILAIFLVIMSIVPTEVFAASTWKEMQKSASDWMSKGKSQIKIDEGKVYDEVLPIARILVNIATAVLVVVTVVMGIKYMTASPDQQAKLKQQLVGLVVSTIVIFGAQAIWAAIYGFMNVL